MAKIGTAHIEIKPVISEDALSLIEDAIADAVAVGVQRGMAAAPAERGRVEEIIQRHIDAAMERSRSHRA